jgi:hypothetical protein
MYVRYLEEFRRLLAELSLLPVPDEGHLSFRRSAMASFRFLIDEHGFEVNETSPIGVSFRRGEIFVDLACSPQDPSGSVVIGLRSSEGDIKDAYAIDHLLYSTNGDVMFDYDQFDFTRPSDIAKFLDTAATLVRQFGVLLGGSSVAWSELKKKSDERDAAYSRLMERINKDRD